MCAACEFKHNNCSLLKFNKMKVIKKDVDSTKVVKCTEFVKGDAK